MRKDPLPTVPASRTIVVIAAALVVLSLAALVVGPLPGDVGLSTALVDAGLGPPFSPLAMVGELASLQGLTVLVVAVSFLGLERGLRPWWLLLAIVLAELTAVALKTVVDRPRPATAALQGLLDPGYPSGHVARITAFALFAGAWWITRDRRVLLWGLTVAAAAAVGLSRVATGAHVPSDVLGGWLVGSLSASVVLVVSVAVDRGWARRSHRPYPGDLR